MKVYVVLQHIETEAFNGNFNVLTELHDVYADEEDAKEFIIERASEEGFEVVSGHWEYDGENQFFATHKTRRYKSCCEFVYVGREVL